MFKTEIEELYKFQSKEELVRKFSVVRQDRQSVILYDFGELKWVVMPDDHLDVRLDDLDLYHRTKPAKVMFTNKSEFTDILHHDKCRQLSKTDNYKFTEFHKACPTLDKKSGSVSLADPVVYGCFVDDKLVSVASLWLWGDKLADIGVLTHPDYRGHGYGKSVCQVLLNEIDKLFLWRCDVKNDASFKLAKQLGFEESGTIYILEK